MIVTTAQLYKVAYGKFNRAHAKGISVEAELGMLGGVQEYANFTAHKNERLGSAEQLDAVRASVGEK